jgi:hypothetical protein
MVAIEYIAFACYPPRSDTSQDGGLVDLSESRKLHVLYLVTAFIVKVLLRVMVYL